MKIAFDAKRIFNNPTGLGNFSRALIDHLHYYFPENEYLLFTPDIGSAGDYERYRDRFTTIESKTRFKNIWRSYSIRKDIESAAVDVFHGLSNEIPFWLRNTKTVVTIHDTIFKVLPDTYPQLDRWLYEEKTRYACKYADAVITISEHTKKDLVRFFGIAPERVRVIYQACDPVYYKTEKLPFSKLPGYLDDLPSEFMLYVGSVIPRKNLLTLIKAIERLPIGQQLPLLVVGSGKHYKKKIESYLLTNRMQHLIHWIPPKIGKEALKVLYSKALLTIYPSLYEGFGLPVVESILCETPVITSNTSALSEAGGQSAVYIDPLNAAELQSAILRILNDYSYYKEQVKKGRQEALKKFDPEICTGKVVEVYRSLV